MNKLKLSNKRHKLLELLGKRIVDVDVKEDTSLAVGIRYSEIQSYLKCDNLEMRLIISRPFEEKEIDIFDVAFKGFYCTEKGLTSYLDKKYLREEGKRQREKAKDIIQIFVPLLALFISIAILIISETKLRSMKTDIQNLQTEIQKLSEPKTK